MDCNKSAEIKDFKLQKYIFVNIYKNLPKKDTFTINTYPNISY